MEHVEALAVDDLAHPAGQVEAEGDAGDGIVRGHREDAADPVEVGDLALGVLAAGRGEGPDLVAELAQPVAQMADVLGHAPGVGVVVRRDETDLHAVSVNRPWECRRAGPRSARSRAGTPRSRSGGACATGPDAPG